MFKRLSNAVTHAVGTPVAFALAVLLVVLWAPTILFLSFDAWNFAINTSTTIITFLMVFLIQSTQNRDAEALQVKLDELLRVTVGAHNALLDLEELEEHELERIRSGYTRLAERARDRLRTGEVDTDAPDTDDAGKA